MAAAIFFLKSLSQALKFPIFALPKDRAFLILGQIPP
jgi:hypothetical protein